jgi:uncharacterized membrane protein YfcA
VSETVLLLLGCLAVFVAALIQGITGFGHALVAIGFLTFLFDAKEAVLILTLVAPVIAIAYFVRVRRQVDWREVAGICLPLCLLGLPLGILLFGRIDAALLNRIVGLLLILSATYFLSPWAPRPRNLPYAWAFGASVLGGFLAGLSSTGGPPIVLYLYAREMAKEKRIAVLQGIFVISSTAKVIQVGVADLYTTSSLVRSAWMAAPIVLGVLIGAAIMPKVPADLIRKAALLLLLVVGVVLVFDVF